MQKKADQESEKVPYQGTLSKIYTKYLKKCLIKGPN